MIKKLVLLPICVVFAASLTSCGKSKEPTPGTAPAKAPANPSAPSAGEGEGRVLAKKILAAYDEAVAEAAKLANAKPESAVLKPKLEQLLATYSTKMAELNVEYLALRTKDIRSFGQANAFMGESRGKHVFQADNALTPAIKYYNLEKGDKEMVQLLTGKLAGLIDIAVKP